MCGRQPPRKALIGIAKGISGAHRGVAENAGAGDFPRQTCAWVRRGYSQSGFRLITEGLDWHSGYHPELINIRTQTITYVISAPCENGCGDTSGIKVSYETVRRWCIRFGPVYANRLRTRSGPGGDRWFVDEVFVRIDGQQHYLFRPLIGMGRSWMSWSGNGGTRPPRSGSSVGFSSDSAERLGALSPANSEATLPRIAR